MSEYQYYECQAIDRPLTEKEMAEVRSYSTRARITPTRGFVNDYSWGSSKGDEDAWMVRYFDAFLYLARAHSSGSTVLVCPQRKSGEVQRTFVSESVAEVARRVLQRGSFSEARFLKAVRLACAKAGVRRFGPGQYRHTVATRLVNAGADPAAVAAFLGHKLPQTTRRFYATLAVVPRPVPLTMAPSGVMAG